MNNVYLYFFFLILKGVTQNSKMKQTNKRKNSDRTVGNPQSLLCCILLSPFCFSLPGRITALGFLVFAGFLNYLSPWASNLRSFLCSQDPRVFSFSSSCCCIPVSGQQNLEKFFLCCSPLCHFPFYIDSLKYLLVLRVLKTIYSANFSTQAFQPAYWQEIAWDQICYQFNYVAP